MPGPWVSMGQSLQDQQGRAMVLGPGAGQVAPSVQKQSVGADRRTSLGSPWTPGSQPAATLPILLLPLG